MTVDQPIYRTTTHDPKCFAWQSPRYAVLPPQASWKGAGVGGWGPMRFLPIILPQPCLANTARGCP